MALPATPIRPQDQEFLDEHFGVQPAWNQFHKNLKKPQFVEAVRQDTRSDTKLKRFAKMVGTREQSRSRPVNVVGDSGKKYKVKYHPEAGRFSCSCPDWTYKKSVGRGECKHIRRLQQGIRSEMMDKTANPLLNIVRLGNELRREDLLQDQNKKISIENEAYKKYLPKESLFSVLGRSGGFNKMAAIRGKAAKALLAKK
jgi:hypothetical protein